MTDVIEAAAKPTDRSYSRRWLIVFNCINAGLANCLRLQTPDLAVETMDFSYFEKNLVAYEKYIDRFDLVITAPHFLKAHNALFAKARRVRTLPLFRFNAYHPDMGYATCHGQTILGLLHGYQSKFVIAALLKGVPKNEVHQLFNGENFQRAGYYDFWNTCKRTILQDFAANDCPLDDYFMSWGTRGCFMHTINHPAIHVVNDIAKAFLKSEGIMSIHSPILPHDNLLGGPVTPVYPEIAERLSIEGSQLFKLPGEYQLITLGEFIDASYEHLRFYDPAGICATPPFRSSLERVISIL